jgi:hypothetical protein
MKLGRLCRKALSSLGSHRSSSAIATGRPFAGDDAVTESAFRVHISSAGVRKPRLKGSPIL